MRSLALALLVVTASLPPGCTVRNPDYVEPGAEDQSPGATDGPSLSPDSRPVSCAKDSDCNDHLSCTTDLCSSSKICQHPIKPGTCLISGACYAEGAPSSSDSCQTCQSSQKKTDWSPLGDGEACTDDGLACTEDVCGGGTCQHQPVADICFIDNACYQPGSSSPSDPCQVCNPALSSTTWSKGGQVACYKDNDSDGFGDNLTKQTFPCSCPKGWVSQGGDCADDNGDVHPGQTNYFTDSYYNTYSGPSWDYDCNGSEEPKYTKIFGGCKKNGSSCTLPTPGWAPPFIPGCGETQQYVSTCTFNMGACYPEYSDQIQACR